MVMRSVVKNMKLANNVTYDNRPVLPQRYQVQRGGHPSIHIAHQGYVFHVSVFGLCMEFLFVHIQIEGRFLLCALHCAKGDIEDGY